MNAIMYMYDNQNRLIMEGNEIAKVLSNHFEDIDSSTNPRQDNIEKCLQHVEP